jgi:hypothetical protein
MPVAISPESGRLLTDTSGPPNLVSLAGTAAWEAAQAMSARSSASKAGKPNAGKNSKAYAKLPIAEFVANQR